MRRQPQRITSGPHSANEIVRRLEPYCREHGIVRLGLCGASARGDTRKGSDIDLIAAFRKIPGLHYFSMEQEMEHLLGVPVDLLLGGRLSPAG